MSSRLCRDTGPPGMTDPRRLREVMVMMKGIPLRMVLR